MDQAARVVAGDEAGAATGRPSWADVSVARRLHCKLPGQLCSGHQPHEVARVARQIPHDDTKCMECGCPNRLVCKTDPKFRGK